MASQAQHQSHDRDVCCAICAGPLRSIERWVDIGLLRQRNTMPFDNPQDRSQHKWKSAIEQTCTIYDPSIVSESSAKWTSELHVISIGLTITEGYLSGTGFIKPNGNACFHRNLKDPPTAPMLEAPCYFDPRAIRNSLPVFPVHMCCLEIFMLVIDELAGLNSLNRLSLYGAMKHLVEPVERVRLTINYGNPPPSNSNKWQSKSGEEYFVAFPFSISPNKDLFCALLGPQFAFPAIPHDFRPHIRSDPFGTISLELACKIGYYLPTKSIFNLLKASGAAHMLLSKDYVFWGNIIQREMPWFYELHGFIQEGLTKGRDVKGMLRWADRATTPKLGLEHWMLGLANRRRIWGACEDLATHYISRLPPSGV
ncbi:hypothetical protein HYFRA_00013264 [Hymenoscyphus fraxineus]|uniref:Uncharacterized protein n=1 Tax=Hymenoscyphus fraxineus TaxID=746836 RepID=A0A9N9PZM2_9HELO|nr:hypothetical protein HYFRA_00013264 [Hymenoscyphus fraxineus]